MAKGSKSVVGMACPQVKGFKLQELRPCQDNPREIEDESLAGLAQSIERFGCVELIVVNVRDGSNRIVGGNQRYRVLKEAGVSECLCVAVDVSEADEGLLSVSLNNPHLQGQFSEQLGAYIDKLRESVSDDDLVSLRIAELQGQECQQSLKPTKDAMRPYQRTHVLLSFPPEVMGELADHLEAILKHPDVEYEQGSN